LTVAAVLLAVYRNEGPLSLSVFDRHQARKLLSYGSWVTVSSVIGPLLHSLDQLVIGSFLGVAAVTHYAVPMNLITRSQIFPSALIRTLFPRLSNLEPEDARRLASRALVSLAYGYGAICAPAIILTPTFFRYWIGDDFAAIAAPIAVILFFGAWINGIAYVPYGLLQSLGRPHVTGKIHAAEIIPFIGILWGLTSTFGITGAAVAWSLRCAGEAILLFSAARESIKELLWALVPLAVMFAAAAIGHAAVSDWQALGLAAGIGLTSLVLGCVLAEDLRRALFSVFAGLLHLLQGARRDIPARSTPLK
jgi:O-antigen/teichoic acid export membrane protein